MKPMLAGKFVIEKVASKLPVYVQPKLDGIRIFGKDGIAYTRSLKPVRSEFVQRLFAEAGDIMNGLDGEIIAGTATADNVYCRTNSSVMSFSKNDELTFHVFDNWNHGGSFHERLNFLNSLKLPDFCRIVETKLIYSIEDLHAEEETFTSLGYEGVIIRNPFGLYKHGRGSPSQCELIKLKKFVDLEAIVTGFIEFRHNGNEATINELGYMERSAHLTNLVPMNTLGSIVAQGRFEDGEPFEVRIGTGFDVKTRKEIWDHREEYLGKLVKFKFFPGGIKEAPRFPVFVGFRDPDDTDQKLVVKSGNLELF